MSTPTHPATLPTLVDGLHRLKQEAPEMPISILICLLGVAVHSPEGNKQLSPLSILELSSAIGQPYSTTSRHLRYLGDFERPGVPGLNLVETGELQSDRRQKFVKLTTKGKRIIEQFMAISKVKAL